MEIDKIYTVMFTTKEEQWTINSFFTTYSAAYLAALNMASEMKEETTFIVETFKKEKQNV